MPRVVVKKWLNASSPKGEVATSYGFRAGYWPCSGTHYARIYVGKWTVEIGIVTGRKNDSR